jgi:hypothetical protein
MISPYLAHIHITSQTFTISNLPGGFTSGLIRSRITCVTRTDKALLNEPTSHARNIRHIFFEPKVLRSCRRRSIMQCSMRNQCSNLFTCIMDYLHVLYMILMVLSCVLYMTLMMFIYMYYGLFTCTNLVDVMLLFFMVFSFHLPIFDKNRPISDKIHPKITTPIFKKNRPIFGLPSFHCSSVVSGVFRPNFFFKFHQFLLNFSKTDRISEVWFSSFHRIFEHYNTFLLS